MQAGDPFDIILLVLRDETLRALGETAGEGHA
jgi:hypothetical protein